MELIMDNIRTFEEIRFEIAKKRIQKLKNHYIHLFIFSIGVVVFFVKYYLGFTINTFPIKNINFDFMLVWALILGAESVSLFVTENILGSKWEQIKIEKIIDSENESNKKVC